MLEYLRKTILFCLWFLLGAFFLFIFSRTPTTPAVHIRYGVTFTPSHARYLGLDDRKLYNAILDDLGVRNLRLAAHWDDIEPKQGQWDFREFDWELLEAQKRGAHIVLAVGRKLPRWPECRVPGWAMGLDKQQLQLEILAMLKTVVMRYRSSPVVGNWQVENEPYFTFGNCPPLSRGFYDQEVSLVRELDPHRSIVGTDSGELGSWIDLARRVDVVGISMYRTTWNSLLGYFSYPLSSSFYAKKNWLVKKFTGKPVIVSELQMEPWLPNRPIHELSFEEFERSFTIKSFQENLTFTRDAGFDTQYLWGVEWWAWAAVHGHPEFWQAARSVFQSVVQ